MPRKVVKKFSTLGGRGVRPKSGKFNTFFLKTFLSRPSKNTNGKKLGIKNLLSFCRCKKGPGAAKAVMLDQLLKIELKQRKYTFKSLVHAKKYLK